jgi:hypothetical protein
MRLIALMLILVSMTLPAFAADTLRPTRFDPDQPDAGMQSLTCADLNQMMTDANGDMILATNWMLGYFYAKGFQLPYSTQSIGTIGGMMLEKCEKAGGTAKLIDLLATFNPPPAAPQ